MINKNAKTAAKKPAVASDETAATPAGPDALYVRIDTEVRGGLRAFAKDTKNNITERDLVEKIARHFLSIKPEEQQELLKGQALRGMSDLIDQYAWANHAFEHRYWTWAAYEFQELARKAEAGNARGFVRIAMYKEGYAWVLMSWRLRNEAIERGEVSFLKSAQKAAMRAIELNSGHLHKLRQRIISYNLSCACSLLAQYKVEETLFSEVRDLYPVDKGTKKASHKTSKEADQKVWEQLGPVWRKKLESKVDAAINATIEIVDYCASVGMYHLQSVVLGDTTSHPGSGFLVKNVPLDPDFTFLRYDSHQRPAFQRILDKEAIESAKPPSLFGYEVEHQDPDDLKQIKALLDRPKQAVDE